MTINITELRRLAQAVSGWSNCNQAWLDQSEDVQAAVVGHIDEDGNTYPIATIDCDQYYAAHQSLPLAKFYAAANPAVISELLDRLEAAEADALEQARLNGMGASREAALMAKLEAAEKERDELRNEIACVKEVEFPRKAQAVADAWKGKCERLEAERDALRAELEKAKSVPMKYRRMEFNAQLQNENTRLRAKIEEMEQQEPVVEVQWAAGIPNGILDFISTDDYLPKLGDKLYALPGAKGEEK